MSDVRVRWMLSWLSYLHWCKTRATRRKTLTRKTSWRSKGWWDGSFTCCRVTQLISSTWCVQRVILSRSAGLQLSLLFVG